MYNKTFSANKQTTLDILCPFLVKYVHNYKLLSFTMYKTENISFYAFHKVDLFSQAFALRFEFNRCSHFPQFSASARNSLVLVCKLPCVNCFVFVCTCVSVAQNKTSFRITSNSSRTKSGFFSRLWINPFENFRLIRWAANKTMICLQVLHPIKNYSSQVSFETYLHCYKMTGENKSFSTSAFKYLFVNKKSAHWRITSFLFVFLKKKRKSKKQ